MKKRVAIAVLVIVGIGVGGWMLWPSAELPVAPRAPTGPIAELASDAQLQAALADAGSATVELRVEDADGAPVPHAKVELFAGDLDPLSRVVCHACGLTAADCSSVETARIATVLLRTGQLRPKPVVEVESDADGRVSVRAPAVALTAVASLPGVGFGAIVPEEEGTTVIVLQPLAPLALQFVDGDHKPVAGARVTLLDRSTLEIVEGTTDGEGAVHVKMATESPWCFAEAPGTLPLSAQCDTLVPLALLPPAKVIVHARAGGHPVDAEVELADAHPYRQHATGGTATFTELRPGSYAVSATFGTLIGMKGGVEATPAGAEVTIELKPGGRLLVEVLDSKGQPVRDANASISNGEDSATGGQTEEGGLLVLGPLPVGNYHLTVNGEGVRSTSRSVDVVPGDTQIDVTLADALKLTGRVVDSDRKPVVGASVELVDSVTMLEISDVPTMAITGEDGTFELQAPEDGHWLLMAGQERVGHVQREITLPSGPVELVLERRAEVEVTVVGPDGKPIGGGSVSVSSTVSPSSADTNTDEHGVAHFAGLDPGPVTIDAQANGFLPGQATATLTLYHVEHLSVTLAKGETIAGTVVDASGKPVASVNVYSELGGARSGEDGTFSMEGCPAGKQVDLLVSDSAVELAEPVKVSAPAQHVIVKVKRLPEVSGRVLDEHHTPLKVFQINGVEFTSEAGRFDAPVNGGSIVIGAAGHEMKAVAVPPETKDLGDIQLVPFASIDGTVLDEAGRPVAGASVHGMAFFEEIFTDEAGHFHASVSNDDTAPFEVSATKGQMSGHATGTISQRMTIQLLSPTRVWGRVLGPDGKPIAATVFMSNGGDTTQNIDAAADGTFSLLLAQGQWTFATRLNRAQQVVDVHGDAVQVVLGTPPGSCGVVLQATERPGLAWLVPASSASGLSDELSEPPPGSVVFSTSSMFAPLEASGVPCGDYFAVAAFRTGISRAPVSVRGGAVKVTLQVPVEVPEIVGDTPSVAAPEATPTPSAPL